MGDQPQPLVVYPNTYTKQYPDPSSSPPTSSSGSSGSFGTVFIVLAVILVLSALACVFGRLCNRGRLPNHQKTSKKSREIRPVEREPTSKADLEFGFDTKRPPLSKPLAGNADDLEFGFDSKRVPSQGIKHGVRFKIPDNGGPDIEFKP